jgi:hypothetical protein
MHAHLRRRFHGLRTFLLALLIPALAAWAAPLAHAQSFLDNAPTLTGGWAANASPLAVGGIYYVTYNTQTVATSTATWAVTLPQPGQYQIYVSSVPTFNVPRTRNASYDISTSFGTHTVGGINQDFAGEQLLGTFTLNSGLNIVRLTDLTGEPSFSHTVVANAVRWVAGSNPSPFPPPSGGPEILGYLDYYGNPVTSVPPGDPVIIVGNGFGTSGTVTFAGFPATGIVRWTPTAIRVIAPLTGSYPTVGPVVVTPSGGAPITGPVFRIDPNASPPQPSPQPPPAPIITGYAATNPRGVLINSAPPTAPLLILGQNFGNGGSVFFNGIPAAAIGSWSPTEIEVTVPAAPYYPFVGPVTVVTNNQTASGPNFTITAPAPSTQGGWAVFSHDSRQTGLADAPLDPRGLTPWSVSVGGTPGSSPVALNGVAYLGSAAGIYAIDTTTHAVKWSRTFAAPVKSAPAASAQVVVVSAGGLYGLNPVDGSILWQRTDIVADADVSPMLANGNVYIGAPSGSGPAMYAVSAGSGANVWATPTPLTGGPNVRSTAAISTDIGLLYVAVGAPLGTTQPGTGLSGIIALQLADGSLAWNGAAMFPGPAPAGISIGYAGSGAQPGPSGVTPALVQAAVFVAAGPNVLAFSAYTGAPIWNRTLNETALLGPPVLSTAGSTGSTLYVGGASGRVYALNSLTGQDAQGGLLPIAPVTGPLALAGNVLFVPTTTGLIAADAPSGAPLWSSPLAAATAVAVVGDSAYVGTSDGRLVGFSR